MKAQWLSSTVVLLLCMGAASISAQAFWEKLSGFSAYSFGFNIENHIFVGSDSGTVYRSMDEGASFELLDVRPTAGSFDIVDQFAVNSQGVLFAYIPLRGLHRSADNGLTWPEVNSTDWGKDLMIDANDNIYVPQLAGDILFSSDDGNTWTTLSLGSVHGLTINAAGHLFAGTWNAGIFRSTDGGASWENVFFDGNVTCWKLAVTPDQKVHALYASYFASEDGGDNWENRHPTFGAVGPMTSYGNDIYVGGFVSDKIYKSSNAGLNWTQLDTSGLRGTIFDNTTENQLALDVNGRIYAFGRVFANPNLTGLYRSVEPVTGINDKFHKLPGEFTLHQNFPNPFNPTSTISFRIPGEALTTLTVYDVLGKKVATLINRRIAAGHHQVQFDGKDMASGLYFYQLKTGSLVTTRKMLLNK